jgi:hypothetical protein
MLRRFHLSYLGPKGRTDFGFSSRLYDCDSSSGPFFFSSNSFWVLHTCSLLVLTELKADCGMEGLGLFYLDLKLGIWALQIFLYDMLLLF